MPLNWGCKFIYDSLASVMAIVGILGSVKEATGGFGTGAGDAAGAAVVSLAGGWPDRVGVVVSTPFDDGDVTPSALRLTGTVRSLPASGSTRLWPTWMV
mgnify:CR=1 FL=1